MGMRVRSDPIGVARLGRVAAQAVEQITKDVLDDVRRYVPIDTGELRSTARAEHLGKMGRVYIGSDHWEYVEYGTRYMRAQPYMRPAIYRVRPLAPVVV